MINETKIGKIIQGVRSDKAVDMEKIKSTIKSVALMMINNKEITECDLNPLLVSEDDRIYAVDIRIKC
jgi:acetyltransferase